MLPLPQASSDLEAGELEWLSGDVIDVPLHWQRWRLDSPRLVQLTEAVHRVARRSLA
jgi:LysR family transcriptional regulator (chromosome initiation inhibitor)